MPDSLIGALCKDVQPIGSPGNNGRYGGQRTPTRLPATPMPLFLNLALNKIECGLFLDNASSRMRIPSRRSNIFGSYFQYILHLILCERRFRLLQQRYDSRRNGCCRGSAIIAECIDLKMSYGADIRLLRIQRCGTLAAVAS